MSTDDSEPGAAEHELVAEHVNQAPNGATEPDEETVLRRLYGGPDAEGIYRGERRP